MWHVLKILKEFPSNSIDCIVTSPPYWQQRDYGIEGQIGLEPTFDEYIEKMLEVTKQLKRILKKTGTFWLNIADTWYGGGHGGGVRKYKQKCLSLIPERLVIRMVDEQGWILRNKIIWIKCLGSNVPIYAKTNGKVIRTRVKDLAKLPLENLYLPTPNGWKKVIRIKKQGKSELITIHLRNGMKIEVTPEHRFIVNKNLVEAKNLKKGMVLEHGKLPDEQGTPLGTYENGWVVGFWLAEGNYEGKKRIRFSINPNEENYTNRLKEWSFKYGGLFRKHDYGNSRNVVITGEVTYAIIKHYTSRAGAKWKRLSFNAFSESNEFLKGVLDGFLAGDGYYDEKNDRWRFRITTNYDLIEDLRVICNRLGFFIRTRLKKAKGFGRYYPCFDIEIRKRRRGHHNQKDDFEILRIIKTRGISYEITIEEPHIFILPDGTLTHNSNAMPESCKDRLSKKWEYIFLLTKSKKYYFNLDAIREPISEESFARYLGQKKPPQPIKEIWKVNNPKQWFFKIRHLKVLERDKNKLINILKKNPGDVWLMNTKPFPEAHFSVFPPELPERCILAGCPDKVCKKCGTPHLTQIHGGYKDAFNIRVRDMKTKPEKWGKLYRASKEEIEKYDEKSYVSPIKEKVIFSCDCNAGFEPGIVLDPFCGSGTTLVVAKRLGRKYIGIDIKPEYVEMSKRRLEKEPEKISSFIRME